MQRAIWVGELVTAKKLAMDAIKTTELKKRQLSSDVKSIEETIRVQAAHCSREEYVSHLEEVSAYICDIGGGAVEAQWQQRGNNDSNKDLRVPILGVFDAYVQKSEGSSKNIHCGGGAAKRKEEMRLLQTTSKERQIYRS